MPAKASSPLLQNAKLIHDLAVSNRMENVLACLQDEPALLSLQQFFGLTNPADAVLLSWFLVNGWPAKEVKLQEILEAFGKDLPGINMYRSSLQSLCSRRLLQSTVGTTKDGGDLGGVYSLPLCVLEAAMDKDLSRIVAPKLDGIRSFLSVIFSQIKRYKYLEIDYALLVACILQLEKEQSHLAELQQLFALGLPADERILLYFLLRNRMGEDNLYLDLADVMKDIFPDPMEQFWFLTRFRNKQLLLQQAGLVTADTKDLESASTVRLDRKAFDIFFPGTPIAVAYNSRLFELVPPSQTTPETLYFNGKEATQLALLQDALQPQTLGKLQQALRLANHSPAITVLLHGHPGTGKTASVLQWARSSGRMVMRVEIAQVRSKWVGDSEKNLRRVFDQYESACRDYEQLPVLLFNEADALFSKRINVERTSDQMHNNMQNILLQAMEDFEGILVATTNLAKQLDAAFDRRFLYKVEFSKPGKQVRMNVLRDVFPTVDTQWLEELDERYELTGAQIRNLGKRLFLQQLLQGGITDRDGLLQGASDELSLQGSSRNPSIGFQVYKKCS